MLRLPACSTQTHSKRPNSRYPAALRSQELSPQTGENTTAESSHSGPDGHALTPQAIQCCTCFVCLALRRYVYKRTLLGCNIHIWTVFPLSWWFLPPYSQFSLRLLILSFTVFSLCVSCEVIRGNNGSIYTTCYACHTRPACSKVHLQTLYGTGPYCTVVYTG